MRSKNKERIEELKAGLYLVAFAVFLFFLILAYSSSVYADAYSHVPGGSGETTLPPCLRDPPFSVYIPPSPQDHFYEVEN